MIVTIQYGSGHTCQEDFPAGTTIGCAGRNARVKAFLGYGDNVQFMVGGIPQSEGTLIAEGMVIKVADKSCSKAI